MERKEHRAALLEDSHPLGSTFSRRKLDHTRHLRLFQARRVWRVRVRSRVRLGGALECERGSGKGPGMNPIGAEGLSGADQNNVRLILTSEAQIH